MNTVNEGTVDVAELKPDEDLPRVCQFLDEVVARAGIPGIAVAMNVNGTTLEAASGVSDARSLAPMTSDMHFELGCFNKFLIAIVTLELANEGRIDLDQAIAHYLPELEGPNGNRIKVRHLLSHTGGYQSENLRDPDIQQDYCYEDFAAEFNQRDMHFVPGTVFDYSHSASVILGRIVETVYNCDAEQLIEEMIFTPLDIEVVGNEHDAPQCITGHLLNPETAELMIPFTVEWCHFWRHSLGGPWITMRDLVKISTALVDCKAFSPYTRQMLLSREISLPARYVGTRAEHPFSEFGLGCAHFMNGVYGVRTNAAGQCAALWFHPEQQIAVAVGINAENAHLRDTCLKKLFESIHPSSTDQTGCAAPGSDIIRSLTPFCRSYKGETGMIFRVFSKEDSIHFETTNDTASEISKIFLQINTEQTSDDDIRLTGIPPFVSIGFFIDSTTGQHHIMIGDRSYRGVV